MIISHKHRFIFIKTRKTAGTSIEVFLSPHCDAGDVLTPIIPPVEPHQTRRDRGLFNPLRELWAARGRDAVATIRQFLIARRFYNHMPAYKVRSRVSRRIWNGYFKFCVERNPWDKTLSHYHHLKRNQPDGRLEFDDYLAQGRYALNYPAYTEPTDPDRLLVDRVLRYERLTEELADVFGTLGVPFDGNLSVRAKSEYRHDRRPYQQVYTEAQQQAVAQLFAQEIKLHGYTF